MKRGTFSFLSVGLSLAFFTSAVYAKVGATAKNQRSKQENSPKIMWHAAEVKPTKSGDLEAVAREYLSAHAKEFGLPSDLKGVKLESVKQSLLGSHLIFQQYLDDFPVEDASVSVSVSDDGKEIYRVYSTATKVVAIRSKTKRKHLSKDQAFDIAWKEIGVSGKLQAEPTAKLVYRMEDGKARLVYRVMLSVAVPFGAWEQDIDASTGKVLSVKDTRLVRINNASEHKFSAKGATLDRQVAFAAFYKTKSRQANFRSVQRATATGLVFDPDPRTTLNNPSLTDTSSADLFEQAYFTKELADVELTDGVYKLNGPWIRIADFEMPNTAPSTTTDGQWLAKRGNNAFNDAMTYYHIDQSQRYMQSLGFTGEKAIQGGPIEVDSNGVGGADNSHFIPGSNQLAFGHGCVDDNEDADVILHEYGHAINHSINGNFRGGDSGAMGEGWGDYWAGSYSVSTENGNVFQPNLVFSWDGPDCWPGRVLNATHLVYDPNKTYGAHEDLGPQNYTDELWSTPLFQALNALMAQGVKRDEVDQVLLEAQFGLGANLKMRDMANSIVLTARRLFPNGPHADVFKEKFLAQRIIDQPHAILTQGNLTITSQGNNGAVDPGETAQLLIAIKNGGTLEAKEVIGTLTASTTGATVISAQSFYPELAPGQTAQNLTAYEIKVDANVPCGEKVKLNLGLGYEGGASSSSNFAIELPLGVPVGASGVAAPDVAIPDDLDEGVSSSITVASDGLVTANFNVDVRIEHTYIGDLIVALISPSGKEVKLHNKSGSSNDHIVGNYPQTLVPADSLSTLIGEPLAGEWRLVVRDTAADDIGKVVSWGITDVIGYECETP